MRYLIGCLLVLCSVGCSRSEHPAPASTASASPLEVREDEHQLVTLRLHPNGLDLVGATLVDQRIPTLKVAEPNPWQLELRSPEGAVLYESRIRAQSELRGEFDEGSETITGVHLLVPEVVFQVRVPNTSGLLVLTVPRETLAPEDARRIGSGETVVVGKVDLAEVRR